MLRETKEVYLNCPGGSNYMDISSIDREIANAQQSQRQICTR
jgi:hypothetical protein